MTIAFPKRLLPCTLGAISLAVAGLSVGMGDRSDPLWAWVTAWFALGGVVFLYLSRRPVIQLRDGMLLTLGIALPLASIREARIVRLWLDGGPVRLLELRLSEKPVLPWHAHLMVRLSPWRWRVFRHLWDYTPPPDPYLVLSLPETDLSDDEIVDALNLAKTT